MQKGKEIMKKRLVGGDFLIDLSSLPLDDEYEDEEIADSDVLEQLAGLKGFIGKDKSIKPLWVKAFVDTDDYTAEVVTRGELNKNGLLFKLAIVLATFELMIDVEFEQLEDGDGNAINDYAIDSATYSFKSTEVSGGTKLYKHSLTFATQNGDIILDFPSNHSEPYDLSDSVDRSLCISAVRLMGGYIQDDVEGTGGRIVDINSSASTFNGYMFSSADEQFVSITMSFQDFDVDVVTEL